MQTTTVGLAEEALRAREAEANRAAGKLRSAVDNLVDAHGRQRTEQDMRRDDLRIATDQLRSAERRVGQAAMIVEQARLLEQAEATARLMSTSAPALLSTVEFTGPEPTDAENDAAAAR